MGNIPSRPIDYTGPDKYKYSITSIVKSSHFYNIHLKMSLCNNSFPISHIILIQEEIFMP